MRDGHLPGCRASPWRQLLQLQTSLVIYADILNCQTGQQSLPAALARHTGMSIMNNAIYSVHQFPYTSLTGVRRSCQLLQRLPRLPSTPCTPQQSPHAQRHAKPIMYARREMANKNPYSTYRQQSWIIIPTLRADCFRTQKCSQHVSMSKIKLTFLSSYFRVIYSPFQFPLLVCCCCMADRT